MIKKESNKVSILEHLEKNFISQSTPALLLGCTFRTVRRLKKRYQEDGFTNEEGRLVIIELTYSFKRKFLNILKQNIMAAAHLY